MIRRINWQLGDNTPDSASLSLNVNGSGSMQINTGFSTSAVSVAFSRTYVERVMDAYGQMLDIFIRVESVNEDGFVLEYENVPDNIPLEINYFAM